MSVPAGTYKLRVDKPGYSSPAETTVTVSAATAVGALALTTAGRTITGTVTLAMQHSVVNIKLAKAFSEAQARIEALETLVAKLAAKVGV